MKFVTLEELTDNQYSELSYNASKEVITGTFVIHICALLNKCGIEIEHTDTYDETVTQAVMEFQDMIDRPATGIMNTELFQALTLCAVKAMNDTVESDDEAEDGVILEKSDSPHYNSFFSEENYKTHRKNRKDIKIVFGNNTITKTIKDVFMRSVTVEVDTSGNPISEIYEFIARDVIESDEILDIDKYTKEEHYTSSDGITYNFKF